MTCKSDTGRIDEDVLWCPQEGPAGPEFWYKLRHNVGFGLVEMVISTNPKPTSYRNFYKDTDRDPSVSVSLVLLKEHHNSRRRSPIYQDFDVSP